MKKILLSILFAHISTLGFSQAPSYVPVNGLIGWWPFNGNANDESGNGNNGIVNGATLTNDRNGVANSAYSFDGDDRIDVGNLNLGQIQYSYTYSTWFRTSSTSNTDKTIISDYNSSSGDDDIFSCWNLLEFNNQVVRCETRNYPNGYGVGSTSPLNNGVWHYMVSVLDRNTGLLELYVDGIFISSTSFPNQTNFDANGFLRFGVHMWSNTFQSSAYWIGEIDDIGIWNRALTQQEITNLYTSTVPVSCLPAYVPTSGLVGYWPFCGNANDESGNGNNGTVNGATLTSDRFGNANSAYDFNLNTDVITCSSTQFQNQEFTISGWFKVISGFSYTAVNIVKYGPNDATSYGGYSLRLDQNDGVCGVGNYQTYGYISDNSNAIFLNQVAPYLNFSLATNWNHYVITKSASSLDIYLNNNLLNSASNLSLTINFLNSLLQFGNQQNSNNNPAGNRQLDDIGIWNRALTDCEIQNLYTSSIPTNTITTASSCDSYVWNGTTYTQSGVYTGPTTNCVTESLNLTITPSSTNTTTASACNSYTWNGQTYTQSGVYTGTTANCVTESFNLTITPSSTNTTAASACDSYVWNGTTYSASGTYTGTTSNCVTESLNLTITPSSTNTTTATACESYTWNGTTYTESGVYTGTTTNCVTESLNLTITPSSTNTTTATACNSYVWNGTTYTESGVYTGTTANCVTESLNLTITPSSTNTTTVAACNNYAWNGQTYTQSGVYTGTTANCVTQALNLTINTNTSSSISQTALDSYTWPVNNQTYTTTGVYTAVIPNAAGCDSTITLNLTMSFTGINDLITSKLSIYPNPTNGDFTITGLELVGTVSSLSLTDMNGKIVKVLDTKATKFSMGGIKPGVYFLNIISENKQEVLKIVKE
jgi:hypothetical protein